MSRFSSSVLVGFTIWRKRFRPDSGACVRMSVIKVENRILYFMIAVFILLTVAISFIGYARTNPSSAISTDQLVVCVDPGHPSENNDGAKLQNGFREVAINWQVAKRLEKLLNDQRIRVVMTKNALGQYVENKTRALIANQAKANLFIHLHCDSGNGRCQGITFYYPDRQGTKDSKTGPPDEIIRKSELASEVIHLKTVAKLAGVLKDNGVKGESLTLIGGQQGALTGSIYSKVPVVTVEMVFLDIPSGARFIGNEIGQQKMAEALKEGILAYLLR